MSYSSPSSARSSTSSSARSSTSSRSSVRACPKISLDALKKATNNFDESKIIVRGNFGITYEGLLEDGQTVAVKRYDIDGNIADEFRNEIQILSKYQNVYFLSIIGKCEESQEMILVHEFMKNGTLEDHLFKGGSDLSWKQRLQICIDVAKGLEFLHHCTSNSKRIIHRNINPASILLGEYFSAKISEFGFAKVGPANTKNSAVKTDVKGLDKYLDPYYNLTGNLTRRSDIYAFGVVMFDVLFGKEDFTGGFDPKKKKLGQWARECLNDKSLYQFIDERLNDQISHECLKEFVEVAARCLDDNPTGRPPMNEVVEKLESTWKISQKTQP